LRRAQHIAYRRAHGEINEEHLLLAFTDDPNAQALFADTRVDFVQLRSALERRLGEASKPPPIFGSMLPLAQSLEEKCAQAASVARDVGRSRLRSMVVLALLTDPPDAPYATVLRSYGLTSEKAIDAIRRSYGRGLSASRHDQRTEHPIDLHGATGHRQSINEGLANLPASRTDRLRTKIFICYRRDSSSHFAGRIYDQLENQFARNVIMDVDDIPLGVDFVQFIADQIAQSKLLLAVIGPHWLDAHDRLGHRRLDDPKDLVRAEISEALRSKIAVIPVTVDGAEMPSEDRLPSDIKSLARRNGIDIRHSSFGSDVQRLIDQIDVLFGVREPLPPFLKRP
jgi:TIR domain-containing protein/ClpA/ClpB-like protein